MDTLAEIKKENADFVTRPLFKKIILFAVPLILSGVLQLLYNTADTLTAGQFVGDSLTERTQAQAAISATSSVIGVVVNLFLGLSVGTLSVLSKYIGAKKADKAMRVEHSSLLFGAVGGLVMLVVCLPLTPAFLNFMNFEESEVLEKAVLYLQIYFIGLPFALVYNFGSATMRAYGDSSTPLVVLAVTSAINIALNLLFAAIFDWGIAGVSAATVVSQAISALLVILLLSKGKRCPTFSFTKMSFGKSELAEVLRIGFPAALQSVIFSLSNVIVQIAINSFGTVETAGNGVAINIEGFVYAAMTAFSQACLAFVGRNYGADKPENIRLILWQCLAAVCAVGIILGGGVCLFSRPLCFLFNADPDVISCATERLWYVAAPFFVCGITEVFVGALRGIGSSLTPTIVSVAGVCGFRIAWIYTVFAFGRSLPILYISYVASWIISDIALAVAYIVIFRKEKKIMLRSRTALGAAGE